MDRMSTIEWVSVNVVSNKLHKKPKKVVILHLLVFIHSSSSNPSSLKGLQKFHQKEEEVELEWKKEKEHESRIRMVSYLYVF